MMKTSTDDTRSHLLATAEQIILHKGFAATGLAEILQTAGVPKGSFYHYFRSKEGFGVAMLERYFADYQARLAQQLSPAQGNVRAALLQYFGGWITHQQCQAGGCLALKLGAEVADLSSAMRTTLAQGTQAIEALLGEAIARGQHSGELVASQPPSQLASTLYSLWMGSALLGKIQQSSAPLERALQQTEWLLPAGPAQ
ncbi:TetR/AcrR family transcriptional regulator [Chitinibacter tainanensis]|uniref:TetR/AcrR family transcriptional regulator n=1 Tax=Chitinibacter tainanensis TaxID=230667 RepID=UPI0004094429|nr:TetR/AcrR family transcriptional regulator [Chitinibacter tainanensis]